MKNVYNDYEIENDTVESMEGQEPLPQFQQPKQPKKRRVEYDEKGRKRVDTSMRWMKIAALGVVLILLNLYVFHTCGAEIFGIK